MVVFWFVIISYILLSITLYLLFEKAGEEGWKGLVPGLNFVVWSKLVGRKPVYALWMLFPIVNIFIYAGLCVDIVRSFGKYTFWDSALAVIYAPLKFFLIWKNPTDKYLGPTLVAERKYQEEMDAALANNDTRAYKKLEANNPYVKGPMREWAEAIVFAVFAAAFIRMFLIEAYTIPTSSMEGSLLVGDFLFVSKAHYGIRTPKTVAMVPLLHNRVPVLNTESYLSEPSIPFTRLPAIEAIDRNDPVVFNYPEGDSVYIFPDRTFSIYDYRRGLPPNYSMAIKSGNKDLVVRPIDKKDHYIKRCVGAPGDTIEVRHRQLFINGKPAKDPTNLQFNYLVLFPEQPNTYKFSEWGISEEDVARYGSMPNGLGPNHMMLVLNEQQKQQLKEMDDRIEFIPNEEYVIKGAQNKLETLKAAGVDERFYRGAYANGDYQVTLNQQYIQALLKVDSSLVIQPFNDTERLFPHDPAHWPQQNIDNYGPVWVPKKGVTVDLRPDNIAMFRRVIEVYEGNDFKEEKGQYFINGQPTSTYTFQQDYYWMMGDNRHNSEDSRVWGYVPHDHVVGKPLFIWFSLKEGTMSKGINWSRIFTSADKQ